ncbi:hypothetical protein A2U01_0089861, partial [Trifolium medium]|nr:hypothetical protein [Trifolium medium]
DRSDLARPASISLPSERSFPVTRNLLAGARKLRVGLSPSELLLAQRAPCFLVS